MLSEKKYYSAAVFAALAVLELISFLIFYLPNYVFDPGSAAEFLGYLIRFSRLAFEMLLPATVAVEAFFYTRGEKISKMAVRVALMSLSTVVYNLPYYYLYSLSLGGTSANGVAWGAGAAAVLAVIGAVHSLLLSLVLRFIVKRSGGEIEKKLDVGRAFELDAAMPFGLLCVSVCQFLYKLAIELYNVIDYLVSYSGSYRLGEIFYMLFSLVFLVAMLFVCQAVCYLVGRLMRKRVDNSGECEE